MKSTGADCIADIPAMLCTVSDYVSGNSPNTQDAEDCKNHFIGITNSCDFPRSGLF